MLSKRTVTNNLNLKIAAVVVAVVLWMFAKGEQTTDQLLSIPLALRNVPKGLTTLTRPPETIDVVFLGDTKELIKLRLWGEPYAVIDMSEAAADRVLRVGLSAANVILPRDSEVQILEVRKPKSLDIDVERLEERRIRVTPVLEGELADGYYMLSGAVSVPDSVTLYGPSSVVREIESVGTVPLSVSGRRSRAEAARRVALDAEWNLHAVPREVRVLVEIEGTEVVNLQGVEVDFRHEPGFASVDIEPSTAELELSGPEHIATRLGPDDVVVLIDARGLPRGVHELVPDVAVPEGVEVVSTTPVRFTVTLQ
ncbi:MAG: CdaR family protein [Candidatus Eisenbacteria bacterium]